MSSIVEEQKLFKGIQFLPGEYFDAYVIRMKIEGYRDDSLTRDQHLALPKHDWMVCKSWHCFDGNPLNRDRVLKELNTRQLARTAPGAASAPPPPSSLAPSHQPSLFNRAYQFITKLW